MGFEESRGLRGPLGKAQRAGPLKSGTFISSLLINISSHRELLEQDGGGGQVYIGLGQGLEGGLEWGSKAGGRPSSNHTRVQDPK